MRAAIRSRWLSEIDCPVRVATAETVLADL